MEDKEESYQNYFMLCDESQFCAVIGM